VFIRAVPNRLRDDQLIIKRYRNDAYFTFTFTEIPGQRFVIASDQ